ncbi:MAG: ABC transporter permease [Deltaproteobacteria bacterium]|nr:ABC transporter permease [Deltaproteobacteria bacterium]
MESKSLNLLAAFFLIVLVWFLGSALLQMDILPPPHAVFKTFIVNFPSELGKHFIASLKRVVISIFFAIGIASPFGILIGQLPTLNKVLSPFIYLIYPVPKVVFVPVIILFFGIGDFAKILMIFIILFFQILVLTRDNATNLRPEVILSVKSLGARRRDLFFHVFLPASLPAIFTGIRQSIGTAIAVLYVAELFATKYGLGYYIYLTGSTLFDYPSMYAGIFAMGILGFGLYFITDFLERVICPWKFS